MLFLKKIVLSSLMIKKILITGSNGMLGKNIIKDKRSKKYKISKISRDKIDLKDQKKLMTYLKKVKPDLIIHCAAKVGGIGDNYKKNLEYFRENSEINNSVIISAKLLGIKNLINFGSSCMYPALAKKPLREKSISIKGLEKTNEGYALSKIMSLQICKMINREKNYKYKTLIPCNLYGPYDNFSLEKGHMIQSAIKKIYNAKRKKLSSIEMWGTGKAKREFMYIQDLVDFIFKIIQNFSTTPDVINVGTGKEYSIKKYYKTIFKILKFNPKIVYIKNMPEGQMSKVLDVKNSKKLDWSSKIDLQNGIKKTIEYFIKNYEN